jgi:hypothetical protein
MEKGMSGRETTINAILEALINEPLGFENLVKKLGGKASRNTVSKYLRELVEEENLVELAPRKGYGERAPYQIVEEKRKEIEEKLESRKTVNHFLSDIEKLSPIEQKELILKLTKERDELKRSHRISELEETKQLPARAVLKKLLTLDYSIKDFFTPLDLEDEDIKNTVKDPFGEHFTLGGCLHNVYVNNVKEELSEVENIEIKIIPPEDFCLTIFDGSNYKNTEHLDELKIKAKYGDGWIPLVYKPIKGAGIIGAWKELLSLYDERFNDKLLQYKEQFKLSDDDWKQVEPSVKEMMEHGCLIGEVYYFLTRFVEGKKVKT